MARTRLIDRETYQIYIAGVWTLEDLYVFPRSYEQCYFLYRAILPIEPGGVDERVLGAFEMFPWQGGYSAVDFYNQLKWATPKRKRPRVVRIHYESPGLIELGSIAVGVAIVISQVVREFCKAAREVSKAYSAIYRDLQQRKLLRMRTETSIRKLSEKEQRVIDTHVKQLASILQVDHKLLNERTGSSYRSLKILLSLFRRIRVLASFQDKGKLNLK